MSKILSFFLKFYRRMAFKEIVSNRIRKEGHLQDFE
jgi:hypothetical protein